MTEVNTDVEIESPRVLASDTCGRGAATGFDVVHVVASLLVADSLLSRGLFCGVECGSAVDLKAGTPDGTDDGEPYSISNLDGSWHSISDGVKDDSSLGTDDGSWDGHGAGKE